MKTTLGEKSPVVLHVRCVTGVGGGPEKTILNSPRFLEGLGYGSACAYMHPPDDPGFSVLFDKAEARNARLISVPDRGPVDWRPLRQLARICRKESVAIWHGHDYKSNLLGLIVRRVWPMKLVTTVHGWVSRTRRTPVYYGIDKLILKYYEEVICVSEDLQAICLTRGVEPERCHLIRNAIDTEEYRRRSSIVEAKRSFGLSDGSILIGGVGRLMDEKGFDILIEAVGQLAATELDVHLWIAGDGPEEKKLQQMARELSLEPRVRLLGNLPDPRPLFEAMDVFALSSRREGLPNVLLEAMAMQVPVVATAVAGVPQLVKDRKNGLLVAAESATELAAGLLRVLRDEELRRDLKLQARRTIETSYSFQERMEKIAAIYDRVLGEKHTETA